MCYTFFCWFNIDERVSPRMMCRWGQAIHRKFKRWWAWSSPCKILCIRYISGSPHHVSGAQPWLWHVEYYAICYSHRRGWTEITDVMTHWEQCITWSLQIFTVQCVSWHCWMEPSNSVIGPQAVAMVQWLHQQVNVWRCMCSGSATSSTSLYASQWQARLVYMYWAADRNQQLLYWCSCGTLVQLCLHPEWYYNVGYWFCCLRAFSLPLHLAFAGPMSFSFM